jgi:pyruvate kinase
MTENPRPTRAEVSDVANAVMDQVDAVMLSAESASGKYPVEAVETMKDVILSVEANPDYKRYIRIDWERIMKEELKFNAIAASAASLAHRIGADLIIVATATGRTARLLSSFRPDAPIIAVTHDQQTLNQLTLLWGVKSLMVRPNHSQETFWKHIIEQTKEAGFAKAGNKVVMVSGPTVGMTGGTNDVKVLTV